MGDKLNDKFNDGADDVFDDLEFDDIFDTTPTNEPDRGVILNTTTKIGKGFTDAYLDTDKKDLALDMVKKVIPNSVNKNNNILLNIKDDFGKELTDNARELKNKSKNLFRNIDRLMPENDAIADGYNKFKGILGLDENEVTAEQKEETESERILSKIESVLGTEDRRKRHEELMYKNMQHKKDMSQLTLLKHIASNLEYSNTFSDNVTNNYMRKSLELQYKSTFALKEQLEVTKKGFDGFRVQLEAIVKNTALPDMVKTRSIEVAKYKARDAIMSKVGNKLFNVNNWSTNLKNNIISKTKAAMYGVLEAIDVGTEMSDAAVSGKEYGLDTRETIGGDIADTLNNMMAKRFKTNIIDRSETLTSWFNKYNTLMLDPEGVLKDKQKEGGILGKLAGWITPFLSGNDRYNNLNISTKDPDAATMFDNRAHTAIVKVIPTLLADILKAVSKSRGSIKTYDYIKDRFTTKDEIINDFKNTLVNSNIENNQTNNDLLNFILESKVRFSNTELKAIVKGFNVFVAKTPSINISKIKEDKFITYFPKRLGKKVQKAILDVIDKSYTKKEELYAILVNIKENIPNPNELINEYKNSGNIDVLLEKGLVKENKVTGNLYLDTDKYFDVNARANVEALDKDYLDTLTDRNSITDKVKDTVTDWIHFGRNWSNDVSNKIIKSFIKKYKNIALLKATSKEEYNVYRTQISNFINKLRNIRDLKLLKKEINKFELDKEIGELYKEYTGNENITNIAKSMLVYVKKEFNRLKDMATSKIDIEQFKDMYLDTVKKIHSARTDAEILLVANEFGEYVDSVKSDLTDGTLNNFFNFDTDIFSTGVKKKKKKKDNIDLVSKPYKKTVINITNLEQLIANSDEIIYKQNGVTIDDISNSYSKKTKSKKKKKKNNKQKTVIEDIEVPYNNMFFNKDSVLPAIGYTPTSKALVPISNNNLTQEVDEYVDTYVIENEYLLPYKKEESVDDSLKTKLESVYKIVKERKVMEVLNDTEAMQFITKNANKIFSRKEGLLFNKFKRDPSGNINLTETLQEKISEFNEARRQKRDDAEAEKREKFKNMSLGDKLLKGSIFDFLPWLYQPEFLKGHRGFSLAGRTALMLGALPITAGYKAAKLGGKATWGITKGVGRIAGKMLGLDEFTFKETTTKAMIYAKEYVNALAKVGSTAGTITFKSGKMVAKPLGKAALKIAKWFNPFDRDKSGYRDGSWRDILSKRTKKTVDKTKEWYNKKKSDIKDKKVSKFDIGAVSVMAAGLIGKTMTKFIGKTNLSKLFSKYMGKNSKLGKLVDYGATIASKSKVITDGIKVITGSAIWKFGSGYFSQSKKFFSGAFEVFDTIKKHVPFLSNLTPEFLGKALGIGLQGLLGYKIAKGAWNLGKGIYTAGKGIKKATNISKNIIKKVKTSEKIKMPDFKKATKDAIDVTKNITKQTNKSFSVLKKVIKNRGFKSGSKVAMKLGTKAATRALPVVGQALIAYDAFKILRNMWEGDDMVTAVSKVAIGEELTDEYLPKLKEPLMKVASIDNKQYLASRNEIVPAVGENKPEPRHIPKLKDNGIKVGATTGLAKPISNSTMTVGISENGTTFKKVNVTSREVENFRVVARNAVIANSICGINKHFVMAQQIQENGWKGKVLNGTNNYFNIKASRGWRGKTKSFRVHEYFAGKKSYVNDGFRVYDNAEQSAIDYANFLLRNKRYRHVLSLGDSSVEETAIAMQQAGYATDPNYAKNIISIAHSDKFNTLLNMIGEVTVPDLTNAVDAIMTKENSDNILKDGPVKKKDPLTIVKEVLVKALTDSFMDDTDINMDIIDKASETPTPKTVKSKTVSKMISPVASESIKHVTNMSMTNKQIEVANRSVRISDKSLSKLNDINMVLKDSLLVQKEMLKSLKDIQDTSVKILEKETNIQTVTATDNRTNVNSDVTTMSKPKIDVSRRQY